MPPEDPSSKESTATQRRAARRELFAQHNYGFVLLLIVASFAFGIAAADERWGSFVYLILQGGTLLLALRSSGAKPRVLRTAAVLVTLLVLGGAMLAIFGTPRTDRAVTGLLAAILILTTIVAILRDLANHPAIDGRTISGALCVYLMVGLFFAFFYQFLGALDKDPFFTSGTDGTSSDYLYFSYVTMTTVGFGDLVAAGDLGRAFVVVEAILGQLYLVTVVGFTVGNAAGRRARRLENEEGRD